MPATCACVYDQSCTADGSSEISVPEEAIVLGRILPDNLVTIAKDHLHSMPDNSFNLPDLLQLPKIINQWLYQLHY